ncbi:hypothetical protein [Celerinatantimonas sp. MCCC 1A17872]|uniref:hypothetical protein n=1 Tax=Celerinatantimonas sp. MCCC 1A17872 TaxID=3177514 RepID=UPI0038CA6456
MSQQQRLLAEYVSDILNDNHNIKSSKKLSHQRSQSDEITTEHMIYRYQFEDGALIRMEVEFDNDADNDALCADEWIDYQVEQQPYDYEISPRQKHFVNRCSQSFWLKMQLANL